MSYTAIIPFYNEDLNILDIIKSLEQVEQIGKVICVDDGSTNDVSEHISISFPKVLVVRLKQNEGKSKAVFEGLKKVSTNNVVLIDADLKNINPSEIKDAICKFETNHLDMLILRNKGDNSFIDSFFRKEIFLSGKRITKRSDLEMITNLNPKRYRLELAINKYMLDSGKKVAWTESSSYNPHKKKKLGFIKGSLIDLKMESSLISYLGVVEYFKQMFFFCKTRV